MRFSLFFFSLLFVSRAPCPRTKNAPHQPTFSRQRYPFSSLLEYISTCTKSIHLSRNSRTGRMISIIGGEVIDQGSESDRPASLSVFASDDMTSDKPLETSASVRGASYTKKQPPPYGHSLLEHFSFDPGYVNLNHGPLLLDHDSLLR